MCYPKKTTAVAQRREKTVLFMIKMSPCQPLETCLYFHVSCIAAGWQTTPTGTTQSTLKRMASPPAAVKTTPNAHRRPSKTWTRLGRRCTQWWAHCLTQTNTVPLCLTKSHLINGFFCCSGLLHAGDQCDGGQPGNHRWDLVWHRVLPGNWSFAVHIFKWERKPPFLNLYKKKLIYSTWN